MSNLINQHPDICSISEFFALASDLGARFPELFPDAPLDGEALWALIGRGYPRTDLMIRHDVAMPEVIYPYKDPTARFGQETGVPLILQATLPHLSRDFDALYDQVATFCRALPEAPIRQHYDALFGFLQAQLGRKIWIERSGGIFNVIEEIHRLWPEARFIHVVRDGRSTAMSMNSHRGFKMFVLGQFLTECLKVDPYYDDNREKLRRVPRQYRAFLPEHFDAEAFDAFRFGLPMMGSLWSGQILKGLKVLDTLPADRLMTLRYEDLLDTPAQELERLAAFLGDDFVQAAWIEHAASLIRAPRSDVDALDADQRKALDSACRAGFEALAERGIPYPFEA